MVDNSLQDGYIIGRVKAVVASKKAVNDIMIYPAETKPKLPGIYTDIPASSAVWSYIGSSQAKWKLVHVPEDWEKQYSRIKISCALPPPSGWQKLIEDESIVASIRSTAHVKPTDKRINGRLSIVMRGLERLIQVKGKDLFVQLYVDGRSVGISNNLTSSLTWDSRNMPDGCYLVELRAYTNGVSQLLFVSTQVVCVLNSL